MTPDGETLWVVDGFAFNVHRVDLAARTDQDLGASPFVRANGLLVDVIALGARAITLPPALFAELIDHEPTRAAERVFLADARADD